jgi:hypothetical protein
MKLPAVAIAVAFVAGICSAFRDSIHGMPERIDSWKCY